MPAIRRILEVDLVSGTTTHSTHGSSYKKVRDVLQTVATGGSRDQLLSSYRWKIHAKIQLLHTIYQFARITPPPPILLCLNFRNIALSNKTQSYQVSTLK